MRRSGLLQLGLLCFILASNITEWQWFQSAAAPCSAPNSQAGIDAFPFALRFRAEALAQIAIPQTVYRELDSICPIVSNAGFSSLDDVHPGVFPGVPLVYSHMSLQW